MYKRLLCIVLCIAIVLPLVSCGQSKTEIPEITAPSNISDSTQEEQDPVEACLTAAQNLIDCEDLNAAITVLEQGILETQSSQLQEMLHAVRSMLPVDLNISTISQAQGKLAQDIVIHSFAAQEQYNGVVQYTLDYSAPEGMEIWVSGVNLNFKSDFVTSGQREQFVFKIDTEYARKMDGLSINFYYNDSDRFYLNATIHWPLKADINQKTEELLVTDAEDPMQGQPVCYSIENTLNADYQFGGCFTAELDNGYTRFWLSYRLPFDATVTVYSPNFCYQKKEQTTGSEQFEDLIFDIKTEKLASVQDFNIDFRISNENKVTVTLDTHKGPSTVTSGVPVGEAYTLPYSIEDQLQTGSANIHKIIARKLDNGYVRYEIEYTASEGMWMCFTNDCHAKVSFYQEAGLTTEGRNTACIDLKQNIAAACPMVQFSMIYEDNDLFHVFINNHAIAAEANLSDGTAVGEVTEIQCSELPGGSFNKMCEIISCSGQLLDNGYVRFKLKYRAPENAPVSFFFPPPNSFRFRSFDITGKSGQINQMIFDVEAKGAPHHYFTGVFNCGIPDNFAFIIPISSFLSEMEESVSPSVKLTVVSPEPDQTDSNSLIDELLKKIGEMAQNILKPTGIDEANALTADTSAIRPLEISRKLITPNAQAGIQPYEEFWFNSFPKNADLTDNVELAYSLTFSDRTVFSNTMPASYDPEALLEWGKDPGLNVEVLHNLGYTGKGAVIAYVDQPAGAHSQYDGDNIHLTNNTNIATSMHGPAVLSLLAGKDIGTAPDAEVWFYGHASWDADQTTHAQCLYQIIEQNKILPENEKITMVGFSDTIDSSEKNAKALQDAVKACEDAGIMVWFCDEYACAGFYPLSDKDNANNVIPTHSYVVPPDLVYVPAGSRTTAATDPYGNYIYWSSSSTSWTMPYVLGLYAIVTEIDPGLSQDDLRKMIVETAYVKNGMRIVNPVEFVSTALNGVGRSEDAEALRTAANANMKYTYAVMNREKMSASDLAATESYLKEISDSQVLVVDTSGMDSAQELYRVLQADNLRRGGQVVGIQLFGDTDLVPAFDVGYQVQTQSGVDDGGRMLTDLFYGNFNNAAEDIEKNYNVMDHFKNGWKVQLVPEWKVARLPLGKGEFKAFFDKYMNFVKAVGLGQQVLVNFSNPIFASQNHIDDMGTFLNRMEAEFGIELGSYRLYGNQLGQHPVPTDVLGGFTAENLTIENRQGVCEFIINSHGQRNNIDKCWFENGREKRESLINANSIHAVLGMNPYYLDMWSCSNGEGMKDNLTTAALSGKCVGMFSSTHIISNNGVNNQVSLQAMTESNFFWFYLIYLKALSENMSRSDAFFEAQKSYGNALIADSRNGIRWNSNYQFNLYNLLGYHNFGVMEPSPAFSCINTVIP